jgi:AcrR family transcriptional regulator
VDETLGRREAHKRATRRVLREAARRLFEEQGYEATTIQEIARAANVTERTFYRYFEGKEGLVADDALAWIEVLHDAIRDRPASEPPFVAVREGLLGVVHRAEADAGATRLWLFSESPRPRSLLPRATPRPLLRVEDSVADAIRGRLAGTPSDGEEFGAQLIARIAVAALRSAAIRHRQLLGEDRPSPGIGRLLQDAFAALAELSGA